VKGGALTAEPIACSFPAIRDLPASNDDLTKRFVEFAPAYPEANKKLRPSCKLQRCQARRGVRS
jgi:hypothetical protein